MSNTRTTAVGLIGVGYWGPNLLRNLLNNPRAAVRVVADAAEQRRAFVRTVAGDADVVADAGRVLEDPAVDAVVIATPAASHFDLAMRALENGKHVLVEKPMARSVAEVGKISAMAASTNRIAMVGHTFVYNNAVQYMKNLLDSGELGDVRYIYSQRLNLGRIRSDVDALWNFAPHDVSIIQYLLGDAVPMSVRRMGMDYVQNGVDDVVFLHVEYPERIMAHVHVSWLDPNKVRRLTLVGSKKMVVYDDVAEHKIAVYDKGVDLMASLGTSMDYDVAPTSQFHYRSGDVVLPRINMREPLANEIDHWLDAIQDGVPCLTGPEHAESVVRILESAGIQSATFSAT